LKRRLSVLPKIDNDSGWIFSIPVTTPCALTREAAISVAFVRLDPGKPVAKA